MICLLWKSSYRFSFHELVLTNFQSNFHHFFPIERSIEINLWIQISMFWIFYHSEWCYNFQIVGLYKLNRNKWWMMRHSIIKRKRLLIWFGMDSCFFFHLKFIQHTCSFNCSSINLVIFFFFFPLFLVAQTLFDWIESIHWNW